MAMTGTFDISDAKDSKKIATMSSRQRRNFNKGARDVQKQQRVITDCIKSWKMLGPDGAPLDDGSNAIWRPPERPVVCVL